MTQAAAALLAQLYTGKLSYFAFESAAKGIDGLSDLVLADLESGYRDRDLDKLGGALMAAPVVADKKYTSILCQIALERDWLFGCQEMALEVLADIPDPASFEPMVELCCRPDLNVVDGTDWRKALYVISAPWNDAQRVEEALTAIVRSGSVLAAEICRPSNPRG